MRKAEETWEHATMCEKRDDLIKNTKKFKAIMKKLQVTDHEKKIVE